MNEAYINGLPSIPFPPENGKKGENGENVLFIYEPSSGITPSENDMALIANNGVTSMNIYDASNNVTTLYKFEFTNKPNYNVQIEKGNDSSIYVTLTNIDNDKIFAIYACHSEAKENLKCENGKCILTSYSSNTTYAFYLYYKEKPYKIAKYLLRAINT